LQVHDARRLEEVLLQVVEEVDAARLQDAARPLGQQLPRLGGARGARQLEAVHAPALLASASAGSTRSGVMGSERTRTPVALKTALAMAARVGTMGGSPRPAADVLFPALATSVRIGTASNMSLGMRILYD